MIHRISKQVRVRFWRDLRLGVPRDAPPELRRCYIALRLACPLHFLSTFPYALLFTVYRAWTLALLVLPLCLSYLAAHKLSRAGRWDAARFLVLAAVAVSIGLFCLLLGEASRLETTLFYGITAPFLFFPVREVRKLAIALAFPSAVWLLLHAGGYGMVQPYPLTHGQILLFRACIEPTTGLLLLVPLFFLLRAQSASERLLGETAARAEASSNAKTVFLAMVSHELRTPLNGLIGNLDLLQTRTPDRERTEILGQARKSGDLLRTLIGDILDLSRMEKGLLALHPQPVQPEELLLHVKSLFEPAARAKGLRLGFSAADGIPRAMLDPERFQQIAINLVGNAMKFTPSGSVDVVLRGRSGAAAKVVELDLEVSDTGIGIPADRLGSLFQPFMQVHRGLQANAEGCGLGLSICRDLAKAMNGVIDVESVVGRGSRFTVHLSVPTAPHDLGSDGSPSSPISNPNQDAPFAEVLRGIALVVDDVHTNRIVATRMLDSLGMRCLIAEDGQQAVDTWIMERCPLVLMDLQMPVLDGLGACRRIRELEKARSELRTIVVAFSANTFAEDRSRCLAAGMDGFLEKPISRRTMLELLLPLVHRIRPDLLA